MGLDSTYFTTKMPWAGICSVTIDGQAMVKIPKFYVRCYTPTSGAFAGKVCREISDCAQTGYHVHPGLVHNGAEMPCFYIGAYEG